MLCNVLRVHVNHPLLRCRQKGMQSETRIGRCQEIILSAFCNAVASPSAFLPPAVA